MSKFHEGGKHQRRHVGAYHSVTSQMLYLHVVIGSV